MIEADLLLGAGKSVLLAGAPGTGKTRDARRIAREYTGVEPFVVVGRGDLGFEGLVYSYELVDGSCRLVLGKLALSVLSSWARLAKGYPPRWVVFDELNRFNVDLVFGELFTGLDLEHRLACPLIEGRLLKRILNDRELLEEVTRNACDDKCSVSVDDVKAAIEKLLNVFPSGAPLPLSWRAIATVNLVDRAHLFRLGFALLRRLPIVLYPSLGSSFEPELKLEELKKVPERAELIVSEVEGKLFQRTFEELRLVNPVFPCDRVVYAVGLTENVIEEAAKRFSGALRVLATVAARMIDAGVEVGPAILVDACKVMLVASLMSVDDEALVSDLIVSSLLLPQLGSIAPALKAEILLTGSSSRLDKIEKLLSLVNDVFGERSRSAMYAEVLRLELPLQGAS